MKKSKISIKWQLFGYLFILVGVLLIVLWLFQIVFMERFYKKIKTKEIKEVAKRIEENIDSSQLISIINQSVENKNLCIILTNAQGKIIYGANTIGPDARIMNLNPVQYWRLGKLSEQSGGAVLIYDNNQYPFGYGDTSQFYNTPGTIYKHYLRNAKAESVIYIKQVIFGNQEAILLINSMIAPVHATITTIRQQLIYMTLIMISLAFMLSIYIAKKIASPIIEINQLAKGLSDNQESIVFEEKGYKEIAELSYTLTHASKELLKTENFRRELIANISHDLRTPLTLISGYAEMMRDLPDENNAENTQVIIDEAQRLTALVNDMLDLSKLQAGTWVMNKETYHFTNSIKEILERYATLTEQEGYHIQFKYDTEVWVKADALKISQVVYNLINNAINYTGDDKCVMVVQKRQENTVRLEVIDTGEGIDKENLPYIWDRYYKVDKLHKRAMIGTGLGLSIVRNILEAHHAQYGVISKKHYGTTFWFELQLVDNK